MADHSSLGQQFQQYPSLGHHDPNQGALFGEREGGGTEHHHLTQFGDLPGPAQHHVESEMTRRYGLSMEDAIGRYSEHIQGAFSRAGGQRAFHEQIGRSAPEGPTHAEGQDWYHGGPGSEASTVRRMAQEHGLPYHVIAGMKAAMSPNASPEEENRRVPQVAELMKQGVSSRQLRSGKHYTGGMHWSAANAASIAESDVKGRSMFEAPGTTSHGTKSTALHGPKPPGYAQSYTHPRHADVSPAIDRHMIRAAIGDREAADKFQSSSSPLTHTIGKGQPGNQQVHGGKLFLAEAIRRASLRHGLTPAEGQTVIWHEKRNRDQEAAGRGPQPESEQQSMLTAKNTVRKSAARR